MCIYAEVPEDGGRVKKAVDDHNMCIYMYVYVYMCVFICAYMLKYLKMEEG
jgi:hypothetical protein